MWIIVSSYSKFCLFFQNSRAIFTFRQEIPIVKKYFLILFTFITLSGLQAAGWEDSGPSDPFLREFSIYPNPTQGEVAISFSTLDANAKLTLKVFSVIGQEMSSTEISPFAGPQKLTLSLDKFPKGVYFVELSNGSQVKTKRVTLI